MKLKFGKSITQVALIIIAISQVPLAIKNAAQIACIGEVSHDLWKTNKSHKGVNVKAIQICTGS